MKAYAKPVSMNCPMSMKTWNQMTQPVATRVMNARANMATLLDSLLITLIIPSLILVLSAVLLISLIIL